jgi:hypothetical protein
VLVQVGAVELGQREAVAREVGRHPVEDHAEAALVQVVDEPREVLRRAEPVGSIDAGDDSVFFLLMPRREGSWRFSSARFGVLSRSVTTAEPTFLPPQHAASTVYLWF